ncbi:MAG: hypothetical protein R6X14_06230 [bacterium]
MRYVGLVDPTSAVYQSWRVPQPEAPYPQDHIIDRDGIVRYWSDQFDPQAVMATMDRLLATGVEEPCPSGSNRPALIVRPHPAGRRFVLTAPGQEGVAEVEVADALGRVVERLEFEGTREWRPDLPAGGYFLRLAGAPGAVPVTILR